MLKSARALFSGRVDLSRRAQWSQIPAGSELHNGRHPCHVSFEWHWVPGLGNVQVWNHALDKEARRSTSFCAACLDELSQRIASTTCHCCVTGVRVAPVHTSP